MKKTVHAFNAGLAILTLGACVLASGLSCSTAPQAAVPVVSSALVAEIAPQPVLPFALPYGVALDAQGRIYVTDMDASRVWRIDDMNGGNLVSLGSRGWGKGQFSTPMGIYVDADGRIYVADYDNHRVVRVDGMDDLTGRGWEVFPLASSGSPWLPSYNFDLEKGGGIVIAESHNAKIHRFDSWKGVESSVFTGEGLDLPGPSLPNGIREDASGRVYYVDSQNRILARMDDMRGKNWTCYPPRR